MKTKRFFIFGLLLVLLALGMVLAGCDNGSTSGEWEGNTTLVGKWYQTQQMADMELGPALYEFMSNGTLLVGGMNQGVTYTTSNGKITAQMNIPEDEAVDVGNVDYFITGIKLTLSNPSASSMFVAGSYYKKAQ
jgi:hypothetical protein